jgi:alpha-L-rhamnosidase
MTASRFRQFVILLVGVCSVAVAAEPPGMWLEGESTKPDTYLAFLGRFDLAHEADVEIRTLGSSWYVIWIDGRYVDEGPVRFEAQHPQYQSTRMKLSAGAHVLAVQAHHIGATTRMLMDMPPFLYCRVLADGKELETRWSCKRLEGYRGQVRRINPQLGWIEWCDTRLNPASWQSAEFDDHSWGSPATAKTKLGKLEPAPIAPVKHITHPAAAVASGPLAEVFGYEFDDVPGRFFLRDLACEHLPPQGVWRRYDLGRVRLARPRFVLDVPAGAIVEFAYSESLTHGRVAPYITLSAGPSCNLDHYVARGGEQEFFPLTPKGGRFVEVHVLAPPAQIRFIKEEFVERTYHDAPEGAFSCGDPLLDRIWMTGVETYRACTEDALIDNPTRERGQWTGDVVSAGMGICSAAYSDLRLCRRGLVQSAWCAREDGLVAGLSPGGTTYLATYAAQWIDACVQYYELTGDRALLEELYPYALRDLAAFEKYLTPDGLTDGAGWVFVDWGYVRNPGPVDMAYNMHFLSAVRAFLRWQDILGRSADRAKYEKTEVQIGRNIRTWLREQLSKGQEGWPAVGYHSAVLGLRLGLIDTAQEGACIAYVKSHILHCFPNSPDAPRLSAPEAANRRLITPYFAHFAFPPLIERGEMDFVLDQYRKCWGWALSEGITTWVEVFDTRWTHCHQWAGCPTWQLSRYVLGLRPRMDLGRNHYVLKVIPGSLPGAKGSLPLADGKGLIKVEWSGQADGLHYVLVTDQPISLHVGSAEGKTQQVTARYEAVLP